MMSCPSPVYFVPTPKSLKSPSSISLPAVFPGRNRSRGFLARWLPGTGGSDTTSPGKLLILGAGYVGRFLARDLKGQGWVVSGTCRSAEKREELEEEGICPLLLDGDEPNLDLLRVLEEQTHLLVSIPPMKGIGDPMLRHAELLRTTLRQGNLRWLCYLSSTSVYGDCGGAWVDEDYPANPSSEVAKLRLEAEKGWLSMGQYLGISSIVFRLGGIYGPGRSAVDTILGRKPLSKGQRMRSSKQFTSRVHVADICQALVASIYRPPPSEIYNVVDDCPAPREEVFEFARVLVKRRLCNWFEEDSYPAETASTLEKRDEKRVSNARLKAELGMRLLYPSYKQGLESIIEQSRIKMCE
ncbi:hypothetical protein MLD38_022235 [Melastoma candidum]|uniref:Uncharacterized protein n=1 Tax=Melastoma candidum TaxID=119954 RepID=A0ACB9QJM0_9MYRT|nr:hypothetical protein MLD38_022235 [Melastoma candidum]